MTTLEGNNRIVSSVAVNVVKPITVIHVVRWKIKTREGPIHQKSSCHSDENCPKISNNFWSSN